jgi:2-dehydropantoate 2-reductase
MPRRLANCRDITQLRMASESIVSKKTNKTTAKSNTYSKTTEPSWHILGAGSIGGLFAAHMQANHIDCCLLLKDAQMAAWQADPHVTIHYATGKHSQTLRTETLNASTPITQLLITTKAQHTLSALQSIAKRLAPNATICLLQNGMGIAEKILEQLPHITLLQASTSEGVNRPDAKNKPFELQHAGRGTTVVGVPNDQSPTAAAQQFALACGPVLNVSCVDNIDDYLWRKLAVNAVINPLTALNDCTNGELAKLPLREAVNQLCNELELFAQHSPHKKSLNHIRQYIFEVILATSNNCSSMRADVLAKRPTEIDYITGFLCDEAKKYGLSLPRHAALLELIRLKTANNV